MREQSAPAPLDRPSQACGVRRQCSARSLTSSLAQLGIHQPPNPPPPLSKHCLSLYHQHPSFEMGEGTQRKNRRNSITSIRTKAFRGFGIKK